MLSNLGKDYNGYGAVENEIYIKDDFPKLAAIILPQHHCQFDGGRPGNIMEDSMAKIIHKITKGYSVVSNTVSQHKVVSFGAKGLLIEMLSLPENFELNKQFFVRKRSTKYEVDKLFKELIDERYLVSEKIRDPKSGRLIKHTWIVSDLPQFTQNVPISNENTPKTSDIPESGNTREWNNQRVVCQTLISKHNIINTNNIKNTHTMVDDEILKTEKNKAEQFGLQLEQFEEFWSHRPGRGKGSNSKALGLKEWNRRLKEGVDPLKLINALKFYNVCCQQDGIINTRSTMQVSTFLGEGEHYETNWEAMATAEPGKKVKTPEELKAEKDRAEEMERQSEAAYLEKMKGYNKTHPLGLRAEA